MLSSARTMPPNAEHSGSECQGGEGRRTRASQPYSLFLPLFQLQPWPHPPLVHRLTEKPPPRATSFLLILAPGPMDSRLRTSREVEVGQDQGVRGQDTQSKCPKLCPSPAASAFFSGACLALVAFPFASGSPRGSSQGCQPALWAASLPSGLSAFRSFLKFSGRKWDLLCAALVLILT